MKHNIQVFTFRFVTTIEPERDASGRVKEFRPQSRYKNERELPLHRYGACPFCRFRIPKNVDFSGVYFLSRNDTITYVGECQSLSKRFNDGYGQISPRNCFEGGQPTNCRINYQILQDVNAGQRIELWFHQTSNHKQLEKKIEGQLQPVWNL
jgi:hypothetical protein